MICLVITCFCMIKMIVSMQFLLSLKMFEVMDDESLELSDHVL